MEKVCLPLWRRQQDEPDPAWAAGDLRKRLQDAPVVRAATLHVESPDHAALRYGAGVDGTPLAGLVLTGLVSVWLDSYHDLGAVEEMLADGPLAAWQSYLVSESVPTPYGEQFTWAEGQRSPGLSIVTLLDKPAGLAERDFYHLWHEMHRLTTSDCHPFWCYVRNEVIRPLSADAPSWRGMVTEAGRTEEDLVDPHRFYKSGGDPEQLRANQRRVFEEVGQFIDMSSIQVLPAHEYVVRRLAGTSP